MSGIKIHTDKIPYLDIFKRVYVKYATLTTKKDDTKKGVAFMSGSVYLKFPAGCGSVWLERSVRDAEAGGSNPLIPTTNMGGL